MRRPLPWWVTVSLAWVVILVLVSGLVWLGVGDAVAFGIGFGCGWAGAIAFR